MMIKPILTSLCLLLLTCVNSQEVLKETARTTTNSTIKPIAQTLDLSKRGACGIPSQTKKRLRKIKCPFRGTTKSELRDRKHELRCCAKTTGLFESEWFLGGVYLMTYFEKLVLWQCPELKRICSDGTYNRFSGYSKMVQLSFCNSSTFQETCRPELSLALGLPTNTSWKNAMNELVPSQLSTQDLLKPCIQVAAYQSKSGGYGYYHEIVDIFAPFCNMAWCGFDAKTFQDRVVTSWMCLTSSCRTNLIISCVACALLALAIVLANVTVISVFTTSPKLRNSQAVYKISLAMADLLVGLFVIPTLISSLTILYHAEFQPGRTINNGSTNSYGIVQRKAGGRLRQRFSPEYLGFVGFFTLLPLIVSLYTLMLASCDRFMAIYQPLHYGRHNAKRIAIWASLVLWIVAIFVSALPFFVSSLTYGIVASVLVACTGTTAMITYGVIMVLPLVLVWTSTLATYIQTIKHARKRQHLTVRRSNSGGSTVNNMETRLARTLASMVGVFTLCLLPPIVVLVVPMFLRELHPYCVDMFIQSSNKAYLSLEFVAVLLLMTNSLWNCFIYNARSQDFKTTAKRLYAKFLRKIGVRYVWGRTRGWARSTARSVRTTTTSVSSKQSLHKKISKSSLRTISNDPANGNPANKNALNGNVGLRVESSPVENEPPNKVRADKESSKPNEDVAIPTNQNHAIPETEKENDVNNHITESV